MHKKKKKTTNKLRAKVKLWCVVKSWPSLPLSSPDPSINSCSWPDFAPSPLHNSLSTIGWRSLAKSSTRQNCHCCFINPTLSQTLAATLPLVSIDDATAGTHKGFSSMNFVDHHVNALLQPSLSPLLANCPRDITKGIQNWGDHMLGIWRNISNLWIFNPLFRSSYLTIATSLLPFSLRMIISVSILEPFGTLATSPCKFSNGLHKLTLSKNTPWSLFGTQCPVF